MLEIGELKPEYLEVINALAAASEQGYFPLKSSGSITLHYDKFGTLVKLVPSPYIKFFKMKRLPLKSLHSQLADSIRGNKTM